MWHPNGVIGRWISPRSPPTLYGKRAASFVICRHNDAVAFKISKILGQRERNSRTTFGVGGVGHGILLQLRNVCDTRILDAPKFFGILFRIGHEGWCWIDVPGVYAIRRSRCAQMRETTAILHPAKRQCRSVLQQCCSGIKDTVVPIRPVLAGKVGFSCFLLLLDRLTPIDRLPPHQRWSPLRLW